MNYGKTFLFLGILTSLLVFIGFSVGGTGGMVFALGFAFIMNFVSYYNSDSIVLKIYKAQPLSKIDYPKIYHTVEELCKNANLPMPKLYIMDNPMPNAFATGRNPQNSAVAFTSGIYNLLSHEELSGVIAHELAHIKNYDTLISTIVATIAGAISMIGNMLMFASLFGGNRENRNPVASIAVMIIAPIVASIIQMSISRQREYAADKLGGQICKNPLYLASALSKLEQFNSNKQYNINSATSHMFIVNPTRDNLFSTHPSTQNRIYNLQEQAKTMNIMENKNFTKNTIQEKKHPFDRDPNNPWL